MTNDNPKDPITWQGVIVFALLCITLLVAIWLVTT